MAGFDGLNGFDEFDGFDGFDGLVGLDGLVRFALSDMLVEIVVRQRNSGYFSYNYIFCPRHSGDFAADIRR